MYLCVDIGGTKTAVALIDSKGKILNKTKIKTDHNYEQFLKNLSTLIKKDTPKNILQTCVAIPGLINREKGVIVSLGNLPWHNVPIKKDLSIFIDSPITIENDAKLGGLGEAIAIGGKDRVLYITISTGIGAALVVDGNLSQDMRDTEIGLMPIYYKKDELQTWGSFSSGKAIFDQYGMRGSDIKDDKIWEDIGHKIAYGTAVACSVFQPEIIIYGGGMGQFANKFSTYVKRYLEDSLPPGVVQPKKILGPKYIEDSVLMGCFEYAKSLDNNA